MRRLRPRAAVGTGAIAGVALVLWVAAAGATHSVLDHVSQGAQDGNGSHPAVFAGASADGSIAFFLTNEPLADTDDDTAFDLYERSAGQTTQVSQGAIGGNSDTGSVSFHGASADGSRVWFSTAEPLVSGDTDGKIDIYQRFAGQTTTQVSAGNGAEDVVFRAASADGKHILFTTREELAISDDDVNRVDIYDRANGALVHVTATGQDGASPDDAFFRGISEDGTRVFFDTFEEVLASDDETGGAALDVYEVVGNQTFHLSEGSNLLSGGSCTFVGASADGTRVFFATSESRDDVTDTDSTQDIYERSAAGLTHISRGAVNGNGSQAATFVDASADGSRVLFTTDEQLAGTDLDTVQDIYERAGGVTRHVSQGGNAATILFFAGASADGSRVFFTTTEPLAGSDTDTSIDLFERAGGVTTQLSRGAINGNGAPHVTFRGASADGTRVFFETAEPLADTDTDTQVDLYERAAGATTQVSRGNGDQPVGFGGLSLNGGRVFFDTVEPLATSDTDEQADVYRAGLASLPQPPLAVTDPAGAITDTEAEMRATITPRGAETVYLFEYGPTTAYGQFTGGAFVPPGSPATAVAIRVGLLAPRTVYHYRVRAANSEGTTIGDDRTFTTLPAAAVSPTTTASSVTPPPATLSATPPTPQAPKLIGGRTIRVRRGAVQLTLACAGPAPCRGSARLASTKPRGSKLGTARYRIAAGKRARVRIRLTAAARRLVARRRVRATLTLRETGAPARRVALTLRRR